MGNFLSWAALPGPATGNDAIRYFLELADCAFLIVNCKILFGIGNNGNNGEKINSINAQGKETWSQCGLANFLSWAALPGPAATGNASKCYFSELVGCEFLIVNWKILFGLGNNGNNREKINSINAQGNETWSQCGLANFLSWAARPGPATGNAAIRYSVGDQ